MRSRFKVQSSTVQGSAVPPVFVIRRLGTLSGRAKHWYVSDLGRWALNLCSAKKFTREEAQALIDARGNATWQIVEVQP